MARERERPTGLVELTPKVLRGENPLTAQQIEFRRRGSQRRRREEWGIKSPLSKGRVKGEYILQLGRNVRADFRATVGSGLGGCARIQKTQLSRGHGNQRGSPPDAIRGEWKKD